MTYPFSHLPKPLSTSEFYILLALAHSSLHAYAIKGAIANDSLGSVTLKDGKLYPLLAKLHEQELIKIARTSPAGKSGKPRTHYTISEIGLIHLKDELTRLDHALKIGKNIGLMPENEIPTDLQRALLPLKNRPQEEAIF